MAHYRALMLPTPLGLTTRVLALVGGGATKGHLRVLTTGTRYHCSGVTRGTGASVAHSCTGMLTAVQGLAAYVVTSGMGIGAIAPIAIRRLATRARFSYLDRTWRARTWMTRRRARVGAGIASLSTAKIPTTVRDGSGIVLWVPHLTTEAIVCLSLLASVLTEGASERLTLPTLLGLSPLLDAVQMEDSVALLAGPNGRLMLDNI